jgi:antitoxin (DNA-binding transcriptional repressor) of toxin-antitoxin stability system
MGCNCGKKTRVVARLTPASARKERTEEIIESGLSPADRKRKIEILKRKKIL